VYRDGLGEGMIQHTVEHEVKQVLSAFPQVSEDYAPKLTFVNVHKKINTRFFAIKVKSQFETFFQSVLHNFFYEHYITFRVTIWITRLRGLLLITQ
jgi:Piwi domain